MAWIIGSINDRERRRLKELGHEPRPACDVCAGIVEGQGLDDGDQCPRCRQGTVGRQDDELVCRGECGTIFVDQDFWGLNVDNDLFALVTADGELLTRFAQLLCAIDDNNGLTDDKFNAIKSDGYLTGTDINDLLARAREVWGRGEKTSTDDRRVWDDDRVQFARLIDELHGVAVDDQVINELSDSMDLSLGRVKSLFARAQEVWERAKPPVDFGEQVADLIAHGLDDQEILERLDPDTAGCDLVALARRFMEDR